MEIFHNLNSKDDLAIAIGFFDGVHLAHQKVIQESINYAQKHNLKSAVLTFKEHPCISLWHVKPQYIMTQQQRIEHIKKLNVDYLYMLDFNDELSSLNALEFLNKIKNTISPHAIFTGFNFFFGKNKSGNANTLQTLSKEFGYKYFEIKEQKDKGLTISSTNIRKFLIDGDIQRANDLLGYNFNFTSEVIKGNQIGRKLGFPTANINYPDEILKIKYGVYLVKVQLKNKTFSGVMNWGKRPTIDDTDTDICEIYIKDFNADIYTQNITIYPQKFIREQKKFDSLDELKNQITSDISIITNF